MKRISWFSKMNFLILSTLLMISVIQSVPLPPSHYQDAVQQIRSMRLLPRNSVVVSHQPSIQISSFKFSDEGRNTLNLQRLLGLDIPSNIIKKLEFRDKKPFVPDVQNEYYEIAEYDEGGLKTASDCGEKKMTRKFSKDNMMCGNAF